MRTDQPDDGLTGDEAAQAGIGVDKVVPHPPTASALGVPGPIVTPGESPSSQTDDTLPDEVNPQKSGLQSGQDVDSGSSEVERLTR